MTLNVYGTICLIVITLALYAVTVEGNCMAGMSKMNPIKKAGGITYKDMCGNCKLKVNQADIKAAIEKGGKPLLDKIASLLDCKEKTELSEGLLSIFATCLAKLQDGKPMCEKNTFDDFSQCAQDEAKAKDIMRKAMACCNNPGFVEIYKIVECLILETTGGMKEKNLIGDKTVEEWKKAKLKCEGAVSGHKELHGLLLDYFKNCA